MTIKKDLFVKYWSDEIEKLCQENMTNIDKEISRMLSLDIRVIALDFDEVYKLYKAFDMVSFFVNRMMGNMEVSEEEYFRFNEMRQAFRMLWDIGVGFDDICDKVGVTNQELFGTDW